MQYIDKKGKAVSIGDTINMMIEADTPVGKISCYKRFTVTQDNIKYLIENGYLREDDSNAVQVDCFLHDLEEKMLVDLTLKTEYKYPIISMLFSCSDTAAIKFVMEYYRYTLVSNKVFSEESDLVYAGIDANKEFIVKPFEKVLPSDTTICIPKKYIKSLRKIVEKFYEN